MRLAFPLVLLLFFALAAFSWLSTTANVDPVSEGQRFLKDVEQADLVDAVKQFGSNRCHCPAKGGWASYLIYQSGAEHNLAFMLGHKFQLAAPNATPVANDRQALLPWEKPEDYVVDFPVSFNKDTYQPYFLPLKLAYGKDMALAEFQDFLKDPDKGAWQGLTLRFRSGLGKGAIAAPAIEIPQELKSDFQSYKQVQEALQQGREPSAKLTDPSANTGGNSKSGNDEVTTNNHEINKESKRAESPIDDEYIRKSFGADVADYLIPKDAGHVVGADGKPLSDDEVAAQLPRLLQTTLRLHIVRRDKIQNWTIYHFALEQPVLIMPDGKQIALRHHQKPKPRAGGDSAKPSSDS
ncbi:MAG TPA: hypothetical protein V6C86_08950 [Oculatellaceae cyanobacterium]